MFNTTRTIRLLALAAVLGVGSGAFVAGPPLLQAQEDVIGDGEGSNGHHHPGSDGLTWCHCDEYDAECKGCHDSEPILN